MKKLLPVILTLAMIMSFAIFASPAAFADDDVTTRDPVSESIKAGDKVIFMSYPYNLSGYTVFWTFEDKDGNVTEAENAPDKFPGLIIEIPDLHRIRLLNTPESMDGLRVQAHFVKANGETISSNYADLHVEPSANFQPQRYTGSQSAQPACSPCNQTANNALKPYVTKHPKDETMLYNGKHSTCFIAYAENCDSVSWECKIGANGTPFPASEAISVYGAELGDIYTNTIYVYNLWADKYDGWYFRAVFCGNDGSTLYSNWAVMLFNGTPPKPCAPKPCIPCHDPCWSPYVMPIWAMPETTVSYTHTEIDSVTVETTYPGTVYPGFCP